MPCPGRRSGSRSCAGGASCYRRSTPSAWTDPVTTAEPNADEQKRGRHAKPDGDERPDDTDLTRETEDSGPQDDATEDGGSPDGGSPDGGSPHGSRAEVQQDDADRDGDTPRAQTPTHEEASLGSRADQAAAQEEEPTQEEEPAPG